MKASRFDRGFTLIEMMIVVAVLGILAAIAGPSYIDYLRRGALPEAPAALSSAKVKMEQMFADNRAYRLPAAAGAPPTVDPCVAGGSDSWISQFDTKNFALTCESTPTTYTLTATGIAGTRVAGFAYTIDQSGVKRTTDIPTIWPAAHAKAGSTSTCWILKRDGSC